jgi:predicted transcriptional regulator
MSKHSLPEPTAGELEILQVLWESGPATVREVHDQLSGRRPVVYTTVLKLLQIMAEKRLVERDETARAHVYQARLTQDEARRRLVGDLLDRLFHGSAKQLVMQALSSRPATREELSEIRRLLDDLTRGAR